MRKYFPEVVNIFIMTAQERINLYMKAIGYLNSDEKEEVKEYSKKIMYFYIIITTVRFVEYRR